MKTILLCCCILFAIIGCKTKEVEPDPTAPYVGTWKSLPFENDLVVTNSTWLIDKIADARIRVLVREHIEFKDKVYGYETDEEYFIDNVEVVKNHAPTFDFEHTESGSTYDVHGSLVVKDGRLIIAVKSVDRKTKESESTIVELYKQ